MGAKSHFEMTETDFSVALQSLRTSMKAAGLDVNEPVLAAWIETHAEVMGWKSAETRSLQNMLHPK